MNNTLGKKIFFEHLYVTSGNEFQAAGPATEKARRLNIERRCRGTDSWWQPAERRSSAAAATEAGIVTSSSRSRVDATRRRRAGQMALFSAARSC